tara:strand:- start:16728 stop:16919 length:192 start_codon:yes stop_codon:yes gene_type:complete
MRDYSSAATTNVVDQLANGDVYSRIAEPTEEDKENSIIVAQTLVARHSNVGATWGYSHLPHSG